MWLSDYFFPSLGVLLTNLMWLSPLPKVQYSLRYRDLGALNPTPYILAVSNCLGLVVYGCLKADHFIFWGEVLGMLLSIYYSISSLLLSTLKVEHEEMHLNSICSALFATLVIWSAICYYASSIDTAESVWIIGLCSCVSTIAYYGAPLSSICTIFKLKDSNSIDVNLVIMNFICSASWLLYAYISINDIFIIVPNLIGCVLAISQFVLWVVFRQNRSERHVEKEKDNRVIDDSLQTFIMGVMWGFPPESNAYKKYSLCR